MTHSHDDWLDEDEKADAYFEAQRGWTRRRVVLLVITLVLIAALLVYVILPALEFWLMPAPNQPLQPALTI